MNYDLIYKQREGVCAFDFLGFSIPGYMRESLLLYEFEGLGVGDFLNAVLENNLVKAVEKADGENIKNLPAYGYYMWNHMPEESWGNKTKIEKWMEKGGRQKTAMEEKFANPTIHVFPPLKLKNKEDQC